MTECPNTIKWTYRFLDLADHVAQWSYDPNTKVGCVIVDEKKRVVSLGYNGFPRGVDDNASRYIDRETKLLFVAHAERNALDNAPLSVEGCSMYVALMPCHECAKSIIQKGIAKVITHRPVNDDGRFNWKTTRQMFKEAGVELVEI